MSNIGTIKIGRMPLGTTEIVKAYLGSTLVYQKITPIPSNYVSNGLVLWLDGIDKGTGGWVDKVSSITFTNNGASFGSNYVQFDGSSSYMSNSSFTPPKSSDGTIEIVFQCDSDGGTSQVIFMPKSGASYMAFGMFSNNRVYMNGGGSGNRYPYSVVPPTSPTSVSLSNARGYTNGSVASRLSTNNSYLAYPESYNKIGNRKSSNSAPFKGKIYSIRIYDRQLSEAEVLSNLAVDNARFNLGLTL